MQIDYAQIASRTNRTLEEVEKVIGQAKESLIPNGKQVPVLENGTMRWYIVTRRGVGLLHTEQGDFYQFDFLINDNWGEYSVLYCGTLDENMMPVFCGEGPFLLRTDSGCETGQLFGDKTCDCRKQLLLAMELIAHKGEGIIVNIPRQDGRGLGLPFKLATLSLQTLLKMDTVEAAHAIAPAGVIDIRTYGGVVAILKYFGLPTSRPINLATNNPHKCDIFIENEYSLSELTGVVIPPTEDTLVHLRAKQEHLGHISLIGPERSSPVESTP